MRMTPEVMRGAAPTRRRKVPAVWMARSTERGRRWDASPPEASSWRTCVEETSGATGPAPPGTANPARSRGMMRASCSIRSNRFHCGLSAARSEPSSSAHFRSGCFRCRCSRRSAVRPFPPSSSSTRETRARGSPMSAMASSVSCARCSKGACSGYPSGCPKTGTNHSSSTGSVASTYAAASRWPTCGGSKLPPNSAISMAPDYLDSVEEEGRAALHELVALQVPCRAQLGRGPSRLDPGAEGRAPGEQVDRRKVLDELVLLGPPAEAGGVLRARVHDACGAEADRLQRLGVGDVDLHALAV